MCVCCVEEERESYSTHIVNTGVKGEFCKGEICCSCIWGMCEWEYGRMGRRRRRRLDVRLVSVFL